MRMRMTLVVIPFFFTIVGCKLLPSSIKFNAPQTPTPFIAYAELKFDPGIRMIEHDAFSPITGSGVKVWVSGLDENSTIVVELMNPEGEKIVITPTVQQDSVVIIDTDIYFMIPYDTNGFYPGLWILEINGSSEIPPYILDYDFAETQFP